jgi:hypothetical protein
MIQNDLELRTTQERIAKFQSILAQLRVTARPDEFEAVTSGYRMEVDRMNAEIMEYLGRPADQALSVAGPAES